MLWFCIQCAVYVVGLIGGFSIPIRAIVSFPDPSHREE